MVTAEQKRTLLAASLGWMLDSMDMMLYSMALVAIQREMGISASTSGLLISLTLVSSAAGGVLFGLLADRFGRARALIGSILVYSVFTAACGFAQNIVQLAVFRVLLGLGVGGEWATGAALVSETWPAEHRAKALGLMQSSWAVGYALAALVTAAVMPRFGWRAVFFVGVLPALVTVWIRRRVPEPEIWKRSSAECGMRSAESSSSASRTPHSAFRILFAVPLRRRTIVVTAMNAASMFGWWGLFTWIPGYLALPVSEGGRGLSILRTSQWILLMQAGMWLGYVMYGVLADALGRKRTYIGYLLIAAALVPFYSLARSPEAVMLLGPFVAFFGTGYFSGFGAISSESFPTTVRGTAMGFAYNFGRGLSAMAPYTIGRLSESYGLGASFLITSAAFLAAALIALGIEETRGKRLE
jgi:MFS family permease